MSVQPLTTEKALRKVLEPMRGVEVNTGHQDLFTLPFMEGIVRSTQSILTQRKSHLKSPLTPNLENKLLVNPSSILSQPKLWSKRLPRKKQP